MKQVRADQLLHGDVVSSNIGWLRIRSVGRRGRKVLIEFDKETPEGRHAEFSPSELVSVRE